jgi:hypothetical protein
MAPAELLPEGFASIDQATMLVGKQEDRGGVQPAGERVVSALSSSIYAMHAVSVAEDPIPQEDLAVVQRRVEGLGQRYALHVAPEEFMIALIPLPKRLQAVVGEPSPERGGAKGLHAGDRSCILVEGAR